MSAQTKSSLAIAALTLGVILFAGGVELWADVGAQYRPLADNDRTPFPSVYIDRKTGCQYLVTTCGIVPRFTGHGQQICGRAT